MNTIILTAQHHYIEPKTQRCINMAARALGLKVIDPEVGNSDIAAARTVLGRAAHQAAGELQWSEWWALMWDADIVAATELVDALLQHRHSAPIVGANYWSRCGRSPSWRGLEGIDYVMGDTGQLYPAQKVGMGFTLIHCSAFEMAGLNAPSLPFEDEPDRVGPHWFKQLPSEQEDYAFCRRVTEAGGTVMLDTRICPGHLTPRETYWYTLAQEQLKPKPKTIRFA